MSGIVVPTLGAKTLLVEVSEILAYQIRQFATTPRTLSVIYHDQVVSLGDILSRNPTDSTAVISATTDALNQLFSRIFGSTGVVVNVTEQARNDASYSLVIFVQVTVAGKPYGVSSSIQVKNGLLILDNDSVVKLS